MAEGLPSATARAVAAHRLGTPRLATAYGDPDADTRLATDLVGDDTPVPPSGGMARLLTARTAFFDRVVVTALERGVTQVANVGAGYDGRACRYAKPGVRWWEVDRPGTQTDKRARLARLGIATPQISFVPVDLGTGDLVGSLVGAGLEPATPSLFVCEGVAVYLGADVLAGMLRDLRALATVGSRLAISIGVRSDAPEHVERRARFEAAVARVGEPARNDVSGEAADDLLATCGWRAVDISERAGRAGFVVAEPV